LTLAQWCVTPASEARLAVAVMSISLNSLT
jgi:hypothetical protein